MSVNRNSFAIRPPGFHIEDQLKVKHEQYQQWFLEQSDTIMRRLNEVEKSNKRYDTVIAKVDQTATTFTYDYDSFKNSISEKVNTHINDYGNRTQGLESKLAYIRQECTQRLNESETNIQSVLKRVEGVVTKQELEDHSKPLIEKIDKVDNQQSLSVKQCENMIASLQDLVTLQSDTISQLSAQITDLNGTLNDLQKQLYEFKFVKMPDVVEEA